VKASPGELELLVTGLLYGALLTHQSFSSEFVVVPVRGKDGIFRNRITLDGELGEFEISVRFLQEEIVIPEEK
jgi:hypothetical protein